MIFGLQDSSDLTEKREGIVDRIIFTAPQLANQWECSVAAVRRLLASGKLPGFDIGGANVCWRVSHDAVLKFEAGLPQRLVTVAEMGRVLKCDVSDIEAVLSQNPDIQASAIIDDKTSAYGSLAFGQVAFLLTMGDGC